MAWSEHAMNVRPKVTVNCAMTADRKIAGHARRQVRISSPQDIERAKGLRASFDAILVGVGTILADDPHLTLKGSPPERNPIRIVLDSKGRTPDDALVLDGRARTIIVTSENCSKTWPGAEVLRFGKEQVDIASLLPSLYQGGIRTLLVEGGGETIFSFFREGLVDRYCVFVGSAILGGRSAPTPVDGEGFSDLDAVKLSLLEHRQLGDGVLLTYGVEHDK